jgi:histidinol-phosphate/aromatic aminotransferase/cobyric acid decarboxylase-like protein
MHDAHLTNGVIPAAGTHGGDGAAVAAALGMAPDEMLDLSASMNPVAPDPVPILARHLRAGVSRYPNPARAEAALAEVMGVDRERLLLTNGGAEAIALVAAEIGGHVVEPEFALHPRGGGPLWRSNPHSPSGLLAGGADLGDERVAVWDEAFYQLATGEWTRGDRDAVVVGSLTKLLAVPGLRVGYVLADPGLIAACRRRQPGWSVNGLVSAALPDLLSTVDLAASARGVRELRAQLTDVLARYGIAARASDANWVLVDSPGLRERLAPHGVLVRDCASFGMTGVARIAVPTADGLARLDAALVAAEVAADVTGQMAGPVDRAAAGADRDAHAALLQDSRGPTPGQRKGRAPTMPTRSASMTAAEVAGPVDRAAAGTDRDAHAALLQGSHGPTPGDPTPRERPGRAPATPTRSTTTGGHRPRPRCAAEPDHRETSSPPTESEAP